MLLWQAASTALSLNEARRWPVAADHQETDEYDSDDDRRYQQPVCVHLPQ
jgi:hypothetical protein